jgi:hypothetical protein
LGISGGVHSHGGHRGRRRPLSAEQINAQNAAMLRWENEVIAREIKRRPLMR